MQVLTNDKNEITSFVIVGTVENGIEVSKEIPADFQKKFKPAYYLYNNGKITINPNWSDPETTVVDTGPSELQQVMMAQAQTTAMMQQMLMAQATDIAKLKQGVD